MFRTSNIFAKALFCLAPVTVFAQMDSIEISKPSFTAFTEFGSIENGTEFDVIQFSDYWVQRSGLWLNFVARKNERLMMDVSLGGIFWNPTYNENSSSENVLRYFAAGSPRLDVSYSFGDPASPYLKIDGGIFQYKYNEYARNLGEYVFRTAAYPQLVYTGGLTYVDVNKATLTGFKATHVIGSMFTHDLIVNMETDLLPHYDLTLTYIAKFNWKNIFKIGAGVELARILPIRPSFTNPDVQFNRYFKFNGTTYVDNKEYYTQRLLGLQNHPGSSSKNDSLKWEKGKILADTLRTIMINNTTISFDQALDTLDLALGATSPSSYSFYKATSITPVVYFSFDPKPILNMEIFGAKDLVLYGEAAILGVENQPVLYEKMSERVILMAGLNLPTFKILDILSFEIENFGSRIPGSSQYSQRDIPKRHGILQPVPQPSIYAAQLSNGYSPDDWTKDDVKWSLLAQRRILNGLTATVQVASDHSRGWIYPSGRRYWELFREPNDWYWMFKLTASI
jgi:hypothetical protein